MADSNTTVEVALKEFEALHQEVMHHREAQATLVTATISLTAGILGGAAVFKDNLAALAPQIQIAGLIIISLLFDSLLWAGVSHYRERGMIALYCREKLRPSIEHALRHELAGRKLQIFDWDLFRHTISYRHGPLTRLSASSFYVARYGLPFMLSLVSLGLAAVLYYDHPELLTAGNALAMGSEGLFAVSAISLLTAPIAGLAAQHHVTAQLASAQLAAEPPDTTAAAPAPAAQPIALEPSS